MINRRDFLASSGAAAMLAAKPAFAASGNLFSGGHEKIRAVMLHMGMNMWCDWRAPGEPVAKGRRYQHDEVFFSEEMWNRAVERACKRKYNCIVMDLGEFLRYPSHPEIAAKGAWSADRMREEVRRLRRLGLEPVPSLNFSATHDSWLGEYHRMLSTRIYYQVCSDILKDVAEIFEQPQAINIGFDEEGYNLQKGRGVVMVRQHEMWWHDLYWFVNQVEKLGARAIAFADYGWKHPEYAKKCPKSLIQQAWYYNQDAQGYEIDKMAPEFQRQLKIILELEEAGFDQFPCVTNWMSDRAKKAGLKNNIENSSKMVEFCRRHIAPERMLGYMMASWTDTKGEATCRFNCAGIDHLANALDKQG
jgi:hypothetical protein